MAVIAAVTAFGTAGTLEAVVGAREDRLAALWPWSVSDHHGDGAQTGATAGDDGDGASAGTSDSEGDGGGATQPADDQRTLLFMVAENGRPPLSVTLLAGTATPGRPAVLHIPVGTLAQIPGFGLERVGAAASFGGGDLVEATVENALGLDIDAHVTITQDLLADFLGRAGDLDIVVPSRIVDRDAADGARELFGAGLQHLDGRRAAQLWTTRADGDDDFDTMARQQLVWDALLEHLAADDSSRARVLADGTPQLRPQGLPDDDAGFAADVLDDLVTAHAAGNLAVDLLPVSVLGGAGAQTTYRIDEPAVDALMADALAASRPTELAAGRVRVQILNGVGTPGVGRRVDRLLDGASVRVVRSDNAVDFDQRTTRILIYDEAPAIRAAAEQVRARLGVGTIELSRQPQSVVDLTIVVGGDFEAGTGG